MHAYRSHTCGELRKEDVGKTVRLSGWVHRVRDHGGLLFIDLRDHYGLTQAVADPHSPAFKEAEKLKPEWVVRIDGEVVARTPETVNPNLPTGEVEVRIKTLEVLSEAKELPLPVFGEPDYPEETRLRYRFLDLRRESLHANIMKRQAIIWSLRHRMREAGFFEFQTPILTASSPEGARDYLVPSRVHPGKFYALPQAPQQFKQLIMIAGFDRYFQIAPCFRDEDARADRSPGEFYQLDLEMSFVTQEDVFDTVEPILRGLFEEFGGGKPVTQKFPRIPYAEAMRKYGTDKPDLRNPIEMEDVTEHFRGSGFKLFAGMIDMDVNTRIWAIPAKGGGVTRLLRPHECLGASRRAAGARLYLLPRRRGGGTDRQEYRRRSGPRRSGRSSDWRTAMPCFFVAGLPNEFADFAGRARVKIGSELGLTATDRFEFCWIVDFPMYEWNEEEGRIDFSHNPVLHAARRARGARNQGAARHPRLSIRRGLQRGRALLRRDPEPQARDHGEGLRHRRLPQGRAGEALRRHAPGPAIWRAAPWRHRAGHRPHGHAAVRRGEFAAGGDVPDEPAGRGPAHGRAV